MNLQRQVFRLNTFTHKNGRMLIETERRFRGEIVCLTVFAAHGFDFRVPLQVFHEAFSYDFSL